MFFFLNISELNKKIVIFKKYSDYVTKTIIWPTSTWKKIFNITSFWEKCKWKPQWSLPIHHEKAVKELTTHQMVWLKITEHSHTSNGKAILSTNLEWSEVLMKPYDPEIIQVFTHDFHKETDTHSFIPDSKHWMAQLSLN